MKICELCLHKMDDNRDRIPEARCGCAGYPPPKEFCVCNQCKKAIENMSTKAVRDEST